MVLSDIGDKSYLKTAEEICCWLKVIADDVQMGNDTCTILGKFACHIFLLCSQVGGVRLYILALFFINNNWVKGE